ncbi:hypothetical protein BAY61_21440 [Prauserella marina]|nr:hypothetical protein [Prauserella marina]ASR37127.1 hypothetical protein BAY61_21440 [Prauserella marina]
MLGDTGSAAITHRGEQGQDKPLQKGGFLRENSSEQFVGECRVVRPCRSGDCFQWVFTRGLRGAGRRASFTVLSDLVAHRPGTEVLILDELGEQLHVDSLRVVGENVAARWVSRT